jgi:hypothetical protein
MRQMLEVGSESRLTRAASTAGTKKISKSISCKRGLRAIRNNFAQHETFAALLPAVEGAAPSDVRHSPNE